MKKLFAYLLLLSTICITTCFVGCSSSDNTSEVPTTCTHNYVTSKVTATCTSQGYTVHTCSECGDVYNDSYTEALGHSFVEGDKNYSCSTCGQSECEGFSFKLATYNDESCYVVTNATESVLFNGTLEVPRKYESLPVRGIMSWAFSGVAQSIKTLVIHDNIKTIYDYLFNGTSIWNPDLESKSTLETLTFDSSCSEMQISANAFYNCVNLSNINVKKGMIKYIPCDAVTTSNGGNAEYLFKGTPYFTNKATVKKGLYYVADLLLHADLNEVGSSVIIDDGTVAINSAIFMNDTVVTEVTIPNSVKSIGDKAFSGCTNLSRITFNGTVAQFKEISIGVSAFSSLTATSVTCTDGEVTSYRYNGWTYAIGD